MSLILNLVSVSMHCSLHGLLGVAHSSLTNERHLCEAEMYSCWPVGSVEGFSMTMKCCNAGDMVLSPQRPSTREYSFILLHTINKAERGWMPGWGGQGGGGKSREKWGGKQPVSTVISPAFCSPAGCERGGRRTFFLLFFPQFVGFGWKDINRSLSRRAGNQPKFFNT